MSETTPPPSGSEGPGEPPAPGWWLASDGQYYPPEPSAPATPSYPSYTPYGAPGYPPAVAGGYGYLAPTTTNGLAIASMVLGILWLYWVGSLLAVIFGAVALSQIKRAQGRQTGGGMAIAGLVLGIVGLVVAAVLIIVAIVAVDDFDGINSDPSDGVCNSDRYYQDPDC